MEFRFFHDYNKMVRRGAAEPLSCPDDGNEYALRIGRDDEPYLQCFVCNSKVKPGKPVYDEIVRTTNEYFRRKHG